MGTFDHDEDIARPDRARQDPGGRTADPTLRAAEAHLLGLQRLVGNAAVAQRLADEDDGENVNRVVSGGGHALDDRTRSTMESALGHDFGAVRVHTGGDAAVSAQRLNAAAYTVGSDIVFGAGAYDPGSTDGQRRLAHELTHVVQQSNGPVDGTDTGTGIRLSDPGDRFERAAEESAERVVAQTSVQREADDEEDELPS